LPARATAIAAIPASGACGLGIALTRVVFIVHSEDED
jgi:hypothetical protein